MLEEGGYERGGKGGGLTARVPLLGKRFNALCRRVC